MSLDCDCFPRKPGLSTGAWWYGSLCYKYLRKDPERSNFEQFQPKKYWRVPSGTKEICNCNLFFTVWAEVYLTKQLQVVT